MGSGRERNIRWILAVLVCVLASAVARGQQKAAEPAPDCCTPAAEKSVAATLGFADIVGIKLGMTPEQALEAAKKFNPQFKLHVIKVRLETPGAPGGYTLAPRYVVAATEGVPKFPNFPKPFTLADGSADEIVLEFTLPPSPPLLAKISRKVTFATGQPVMASTLIEALQKKYGKESLNANNSLYWVFDAAGKPMTVPAQGAVRNCIPVGPYDGFSWQGGGGGQMPMPGDDLERPAPEPVNLETFGISPNMPGFSTERAASCQGITIFQAFELGGNVPPTSKQMVMQTTLQNGSLLYESRRATYDWIQSKRAELKAKADDAAKQRSAPKL